MSEFRKPLAADSMQDHAEQHGHAHDEIQAIKAKDIDLENKVNKNEDRISALNHELDAIAESRAGGEWILSSDASTEGNMALETQDLTGLDNRLFINATDANGVVANMSTIKVGDYIEILEEHEVVNRVTQDYALYKVKAEYTNNYLDVELTEGRGFADMGRRFFVKSFKISEGLDIAELDARYAIKVHSHDNYSLDSHGHDYAPTSHTHPSTPFHTPPGRPFVFGSAPNEGEFYADNSGNLYLNRMDQNGLVRVMPTYPDFAWATPSKITVWDNESGYLKYACEAGKSSDYKTDTIVFKNGKLLYNKGLVSGKTYYITVEGYW